MYVYPNSVLQAFSKRPKPIVCAAIALVLAGCSSELDKDVLLLANQGEYASNVRIKASTDDVEQSALGSVNLTSENLDMGTKSGSDQLVGLRFDKLSIPRDAVITEAYIQFQSSKTAKGAASFNLRAQLGDAEPFGKVRGNISQRKLTTTSTPWQPDAWHAKGKTGTAQRTPDLSAIIQEVVNRADWRSGNALAFIISGRGKRTAVSYDGSAVGAPLLHVSYSSAEAVPPKAPAPNPAPTRPAAELGALRAFPGAEGFGSDTVGGRDGRVVFVTNLNDSGPGSLRAAVEASGPRTVLFEIGGTITLSKRLSLTHPYITVAGQSAPGDGILLRGGGNDEPLLEISTHDVVIRYLRFRKGPGGGKDNLTLTSGAHNVVIDHNSFSWATDENINTYRDVYDVTFSWNIIAEPLHCSTHEEGCHGKNGAMGKYETGSQSFHHNLLMSSYDRSVQLNQAYGVADYVNNVHYNNYDMTYLRGDYVGEDRRGDFVGLNFVGNWYAYGPDSRQDGDYKPELRLKGADPSEMKVYAKGNLGPSRSSDNLPDWDIVDEWDLRYSSTNRFDAPQVTTTPAEKAYEQVLDQAGASLPRRDLTDVRLVEEIKRRTGQWVDHPDQVGGWPLLRSGILPQDRDNDGMADSWEEARGLNPTNQDASDDRDGDGYTNLEEYLAWLER